MPVTIRLETLPTVLAVCPFSVICPTLPRIGNVIGNTVLGGGGTSSGVPSTIVPVTSMFPTRPVGPLPHEAVIVFAVRRPGSSAPMPPTCRFSTRARLKMPVLSGIAVAVGILLAGRDDGERPRAEKAGEHRDAREIQRSCRSRATTWGQRHFRRWTDVDERQKNLDVPSDAEGAPIDLRMQIAHGTEDAGHQEPTPRRTYGKTCVSQFAPKFVVKCAGGTAEQTRYPLFFLCFQASGRPCVSDKNCGVLLTRRPVRQRCATVEVGSAMREFDGLGVTCYFYRTRVIEIAS